MKERHTKIVELVARRHRVEVSELAELVGASAVTVRKDLDFLAERGLLRRERGYALSANPDDINYHMAFAYERKRKIAHAALDEVEDGETVMIESGSCCVLFAEQLARHRRDITIITNSAYLASYIREESVKIILLGGEYQPRFQAMVGPLVKLCAEKYQVDKLFVSADGFSESFGFTGGDLTRVEAIRSMAQSARQVVLLAESEKFSRVGPVSYFALDEVSTVITDHLIPEEARQVLSQYPIRLRVVP